MKAVLLALGTLWSAQAQQTGNSFNRNQLVNQALFSSVANWPCTKLITKDGPVGCGSKSREDAGGILYYFASPAEIDQMVAGSVPESIESISPVIEEADLTRATLDKLNSLNSKVNVDNVIVVRRDANGTTSIPPSPENVTGGDGALYINSPYMMSMMRDKASSDLIRSKAKENAESGFGSSPPWQHRARFPMYMGKQAATVEDCINLRQCQPMGGLSVWSTVGAKLDQGKESVLLATAMDSTAVFHDLAFGRNSAASGMAVALLAARTLGSADRSALEKQIVVSLFQGEAFYRAGSRRFVRDISIGGCDELEECNNYKSETCRSPTVYSLAWERLAIGSISHVLALDQLIPGDPANPKWFVHGGAASLKDVVVQQAAGKAASSSVPGLPPSSLDSFVENRNFTGEAMLITGYDSTVGREFHSHYDVTSGSDAVENATATALASLATSVARTLFVAAGGENAATAVADVPIEQALELWSCLAKDFSCDLLATTLNMTLDNIKAERKRFTISANPNTGSETGPVSMFSSVYRPFQVEKDNISLLENFVRQYLAQHTMPAKALESELKAASDSNLICTNDIKCFAYRENMTCATGISSASCVQGVCICPNSFFHDALSPSFRVNHTAFRTVDNKRCPSSVSLVVDTAWQDPKDPLFMEPTWNSVQLELFKESAKNLTTLAVLISGVVLTIVTWVLVAELKKSFHGTRLKLD